MPATRSSVLALDVGGVRVGVAIMSIDAKLPHPLRTLTSQGQDLFAEIKSIINEESVSQLVIGLPRGLSGQNTSQTEETISFVETLKTQVTIPIDMQDEALSSSRAKDELEKRGKPYTKGDIDALAATYILEDWYIDHKGNI